MEPGVYDEMRQLERDHWWFVARRRILAGEIGRLPLPAGSRVLEVGCGPGGNLEMLGQFGPLTAIEPDEASRAYAAKSGAEMHGGLLPDGLPDFPERFGLVAALDVVEHVDDDAGALAALGALTRPDGFMVITVPAYQWMWSEHDVRHHHKRRYTAGQLRGRLEAAGLKVRRLTHFNSLLFPPIAAVRLLQKLPGLDGQAEEHLPGAAVNGLLRRIFETEGALLRATDLPFGVSILAICQRPA